MRCGAWKAGWRKAIVAQGQSGVVAEGFVLREKGWVMEVGCQAILSRCTGLKVVRPQMVCSPVDVVGQNALMISRLRGLNPRW
jgi:hypothetical protein